MPVLRLCGGRVSIRCSPSRMRPWSSSQKPATIRSSVVFPQPEGPSSVKNSPSRIAIDTLSTAGTSVKLRVTQSIVIAVTPASLLYFSSMIFSENRFPLFRIMLSARPPDDILDFLRGFGALFHPGVLVIIDELDVGELRHLPRQLGEIKIASRSATEREAQDLLSDVLARDVIGERLRVLGVRAALDNGDAFH